MRNHLAATLCRVTPPNSPTQPLVDPGTAPHGVEPSGGAAGAGRTELDRAELGAWRGFLRVHAELAKALDAELAAEHDLPLSSYEVLITLQSAPERRCRMAELADRVLLSRSGTTRLVDRLEREGLLVRDTCTSDGRGCFAVLTDAGDALLARARPTHLGGVRERFLRHFAPDELATLSAWWERVLPGAAGDADLSRSD
jgi:DNA-binding MarR family transcriptional regulator